MPEIRVELGDRSYPVIVQRGVIVHLQERLAAVGLGAAPLLMITDEPVAQAQSSVLHALQNLPGHSTDAAIVPGGEESKSLQGFSFLLDRLAAFDQGRGVAVIALGGGAVGDLAGFTAACYKRGVPWVQIPTTLLAQVDASVGGKTAINHPAAKNLIGAFHQPLLVLADVDLLATLPGRELRSGLAEVIKHGVIADEAFFSRMEQTLPCALAGDPEPLEDYVAASCRIKAAVVALDERDTTGARAALNYGHTFGHAIEIAAHYRYAHGEAIAIGMACAGDLAVKMGLLPQTDADRIEAAIRAAGLPATAEDLSLESIFNAMRLDKKFVLGANRFVLAHRIGQVAIHGGVPDPLIREVLASRVHNA